MRFLIIIIVSFYTQHAVSQDLSESDYKAINNYLISWHNIFLDLQYHRDSKNLKLEHYLKDCNMCSDTVISLFSPAINHIDSTSKYIVAKLNTSYHSALYCLFDLEKRLPFSIVSMEQMNQIFKEWSPDLSNFEKSIIFILLSRDFKHSHIAIHQENFQQSQIINTPFYNINFNHEKGNENNSHMGRKQVLKVFRNSKNEYVLIIFNKAGEIINVKH